MNIKFHREGRFKDAMLSVKNELNGLRKSYD